MMSLDSSSFSASVSSTMISASFKSKSLYVDDEIGGGGGGGGNCDDIEFDVDIALANIDAIEKAMIVTHLDWTGFSSKQGERIKNVI